MSFRLKTILGLALIEVTLLGLLIWGGLWVLRESTNRELVTRATTTAEILASATRHAVVATDLASIEDLVLELLRHSDLVYARVLDADGSVLAAGGDPIVLARPFVLDRRVQDTTDGVFDAAAPILVDSMPFGRVELGLPTDLLQHVYTSARDRALGIVGLEMLLVTLFSFLLGGYLTRQLDGLTRASERIAGGDFAYRIPVKGHDELARTAIAFNAMSERVEELYRQTQEEELRKGAIIDAALDCIIAADAEGRITEFNPAAESTFGYRRAEILGKPMADHIIPPALREAHNRGMSRFLAKGQGPVIGKRLEMPAWRADQTEFPVELTVNAVESERGPSFVAYIRDISARKQAEQERQRLLQALEASADSIIISDPQGVIRYANPAFGLISGWDAEEIIGQPTRILGSGRMPSETYANLWTTISAGRTWTGRFLNRRKGQSVSEEPLLYWAQSTIAPILDPNSGEVQGYVAVQRDVTSDVAREERQVLEQESAEIRAEIARLLQSQSPIRERLERVLEALTRLQGVATRDCACLLLDVSKGIVADAFLTHAACHWTTRPTAEQVDRTLTATAGHPAEPDLRGIDLAALLPMLTEEDHPGVLATRSAGDHDRVGADPRPGSPHHASHDWGDPRACDRQSSGPERDGARTSRRGTGRAGQVPVPCQHEPRDPHADVRGSGHARYGR
jgi:PAS domain S-box-containing protein